MGVPENEYQAPPGPPPPPPAAESSDMPAPLRSHPSPRYSQQPSNHHTGQPQHEGYFTPSLHNFNPATVKPEPLYDPENQQYAPPVQASNSSAEQWVPAASQAAGEVPGSSISKPSTMQKAKKDGKKAFDVAWDGLMKLGGPVNRLTNRIGSEAFWPTTLDRESDKAARILKSFCKDGFYADPPKTDMPADGPQNKQKVLVKIPQKVIQNAVGLAIFSTMRAGLWVSGAGGSGVLIARLPDGSWSPPSGILIHTLGLGFMVGIDIYDCVLVINSYEALKAFQSFRVTLGTEMSVVAGPVGAGGIIEADVRPDTKNKRAVQRGESFDPATTAFLQAQEKEKRSRKPVFTYMKSRGLYVGLQVDGTFILERNDENAVFYGEKARVAEILRAQVRTIPPSTRMLMEVVKAAEGREADAQLMSEISHQPAPSDVAVHKTQEPTNDQKLAFGPDAQSQAHMSAIAPPLAEHPANRASTTIDQKVTFAEGPQTIPITMPSTSSPHTSQTQDHFPPYNPADFGAKSQGETSLDRELHDMAVQDYSLPPPEGDAELAARLQAEEHERARAIDEDRGPERPPRPVSVPPPYAETSGSGALGHGDGNGASSAYPPDQKAGAKYRYT